MGACYVSAFLRKHGYTDIQFYNQDVYHYSEEHLTRFLSENHFDVAGTGFVAGYYQHVKIKQICDAILRVKNRPFIVLGGHGPTPVPEFYLRYTGADAVVMGEGEVPFLNLVRALENNVPFSTVRGIAYREGSDCKVNERERPIKDLDSIPFPDYQFLPMEYYINAKFLQMTPTDRQIAMIGSRGCNYHCNFCQRLEKGIRFRSIPNVIDELEKYLQEYRISYVMFYDELFMHSEKRVEQFCSAIRDENIKIHYFCTGRLDTVNEHIVEIMKESGCVSIDYGIEQFDDGALKAMNKRLTEREIIQGIELTKRAGINIAFNIIFGNIGDTRASLKKSLSFLKQYNDFSQLRVIRPVTPYPGSPLYDYAIAQGYLTGPEDFYRKHKNLELPTVNFTDIPDDEFNRLMFDANKEIIEDYYDHLKQQMIGNFSKVYFDKDYGFRGARHA
jgi:anaerobic magnesium-protoporphyrin IX monomethyl ester cyclase